MRLQEIIAGTDLSFEGAGPEIHAIVHDSRQVGAGALFVCLPGQVVDGHDFARAAVERGAVAVVAERPLDLPVPVLRTADARATMALLAANLHGRPGERLRVAGITGTNGKTTVSWILQAIAEAAGRDCGVIGTVGYRVGGRTLPAPHTTPESVGVQALLAQMVEAGTELAVMEVSSHALVQERVGGLRFAAAAFTNLTRDHLDFHGDMDAYFAAKERLFLEHLAPGGVAVIHADDPRGRALCDRLAGRDVQVWGYSQSDASCALHATDVHMGIEGIAATLHTPAGALEIRSPLVGAHNLQNLLCATGLALALGLPPAAIETALRTSSGAPGRLERVDGRGVAAFVDYAHTDDALRRVIAALREVGPRRLIVVFGCGGDRDRGKRPLMGQVAAAGADLAIVTSDNPRTEDPEAIVADIVPGAEAAGRRRLEATEAQAGADGFVVEVDRRRAIELAVRCARPGDVILIAGKGHEDYQIVGTEKIHFDDLEEARRALGA